MQDPEAKVESGSSEQDCVMKLSPQKVIPEEEQNGNSTEVRGPLRARKSASQGT